VHLLAVLSSGLGAKLEQATSDHEAALKSTSTFTVHSQFPGHMLMNIMNEAIKVGTLNWHATHGLRSSSCNNASRHNGS